MRKIFNRILHQYLKNMFKQLALILALATITGNVHSQAFEGKVKYGRTEEPAIGMVYNYNEEVVEKALLSRLADKRLKGSRSKGFYIYKNAVINEISRSSMDYSFKVEEKGRRGAEKTTVYMVMQGSGDIDNAGSLSRKGKDFLEEMAPYVKRSNTVMQIRKQEGLLTEEEEKLKELKEDQEALEKKLADNKKKQTSQQKIIASQQSILADLKEKVD